MLNANSLSEINKIGSYNEWDPLEEVIIGHIDNAHWPDWDLVESVPVSQDLRKEVNELRGHWIRYPDEVIANAKKCIAELTAILEGEGVRVRTPDLFAFDRAYKTPHWQVNRGFCAANPRDVILVIGQLFIECPMAHRGRYYELFPYRTLLKEYWARGASWIAAPRPELRDELYDNDYRFPEGGPEEVDDDWEKVNTDEMTYFTTEVEPVFDAADFIRCGRDIFYQRSQVTNLAGIKWMRQLLGETYRLHAIQSRCPSAYHIDTTFMPLAPGKVLINPNYVDPKALPEILKRWDILIPPRPRSTPLELAGWMSDWISMNFLMIDEKRVIVEREQEDFILALRRWGFQPIPCSFKHYYPFLGSIHCATLDTVRRGKLEDYS